MGEVLDIIQTFRVLESELVEKNDFIFADR